MSDNPYPDGGDTMHYELHTAWDEGYAEGFAAGRAAATPDPPDGRLDAVYAERNAVVLGLAKAGLMLGWRVGKASDPSEPDWPVVYIDTPAGQVSWHFRAADVPDWVEPYPGEWDRHSDTEKYERLSRLPVSPAASPDERLREAVRDFLDGVFEGDGRWDRLHAALAATDRDKPDGTTPTFCCRPDCGLRATRIAPDPDGVRWRPYCSDCSLPVSPEPKDRDPKEKP